MESFFAQRNIAFVSLLAVACLLALVLPACNANISLQDKEVISAEEQKEAAEEKKNDLSEDIRESLETLCASQQGLGDSIPDKNAALIKDLYQRNDFGSLWSANGALRAETDSLVLLVNNALYYGLFPTDYSQQKLATLTQQLRSGGTPTAAGKATDWAAFDMLATSVFIQLVKDLKGGRLIADSVLMKDSTFTAPFFADQKMQLANSSIDSFAYRLEPAVQDYHKLKAALKTFLPKANLAKYTLIKTKDSLLLPKVVYKRILEEDSLKLKAVKAPDSATIKAAVSKYQKWRKLKVDGLITPALIKRLNLTDREKFIRIAISLDRYKQLPALPTEYIWVNLPSYYMEVREGDSVRIKSKVVCGKPITKTPQITSVITDMITYPQWTIPESIIKKEILPGLKNDAGYTRRKGYSIVDGKGKEIDPYAENWFKYKNLIPYKVVQGSGDANALGVIKFNFSNPYAVYLHDTNQRYLFSKSSRALSHGCVRVQQWRELAYYILRKDKLMDSTKAVSTDSLDSWLKAKKKKYIKVQQQLPLFIRYITCEGQNAKLVMHEDIYEEDKRIRETVFASK